MCGSLSSSASVIHAVDGIIIPSLRHNHTQLKLDQCELIINWLSENAKLLLRKIVSNSNILDILAEKSSGNTESFGWTRLTKCWFYGGDFKPAVKLLKFWQNLNKASDASRLIEQLWRPPALTWKRSHFVRGRVKNAQFCDDEWLCACD